MKIPSPFREEKSIKKNMQRTTSEHTVAAELVLYHHRQSSPLFIPTTTWKMFGSVVLKCDDYCRCVVYNLIDLILIKF
jgi:hypothetical protein